MMGGFLCALKRHNNGTIGVLHRPSRQKRDKPKYLSRFTLHREAPPGFEPGIKDLQSSALPLGYGAN